MTREELLQKYENGELPEGITIDENGVVRNAHGIDITLVGKVLAEFVRSYEYSIGVILKYDSNFESNNDEIINVHIDTALLGGDLRKIIAKLSSVKKSIHSYASNLVNTKSLSSLAILLILTEVDRLVNLLNVEIDILQIS
ncbi:TPA: hypothetical protein ACXKAZ_001835 [Pseudomonas aeruginosa]